MSDAEAVRRLANDLIDRHLPGGVWAFAFDSAKRRAGLTDYGKHRISVSRYLVGGDTGTDLAEIEQVLLHEIAHALAGHRAAHGPVWRATAAGIGYHGGRLHGRRIADDRAPWVGTCAAGHTHYRFRAPTTPLSCGTCSAGFSRAALVTWRRRVPAHAVPVGTAPARTAAVTP